jgi:hypothetical protein
MIGLLELGRGHIPERFMPTTVVVPGDPVERRGRDGEVGFTGRLPARPVPVIALPR